VQAALKALSHSKFFGGLALRTLVFDLKQVRRYLTDPGLRAAARARVIDLIGPDTEVVVGHSLGSVVAYEALHAQGASDRSKGPRDDNLPRAIDGGQHSLGMEYGPDTTLADLMAEEGRFRAAQSAAVCRPDSPLRLAPGWAN